VTHTYIFATVTFTSIFCIHTFFDVDVRETEGRKITRYTHFR